MFTRSTNTKVTQAALTMGKNKTTLPVPTPASAEPNATKRSRDDLDKSDDHVDSLDELWNRMQQMFIETNTKIAVNIENCQRELQTEIGVLRDDMQQLKAECSSEVRRLADSVTSVCGDVRVNKEGILATERSNDLLLSGVPFQSSEDLMDIFSRIANVLGYDRANIPHIYAKRLARYPIAIGAASPIAFQFAFKLARDDFYNRYLSSRNLSLIHLGFEVNKRIFLNENLTEDARRIKSEAVKLKKAGKLLSVFTRNGAVFVKDNADAASQRINSVDQLFLHKDP